MESIVHGSKSQCIGAKHLGNMCENKIAIVLGFLIRPLTKLDSRMLLTPDEQIWNHGWLLSGSKYVQRNVIVLSIWPRSD